ncbi:MAG: T9SS type A sorting domain-containing protein [Saprospiraceae bacterium]
MKKLLLLSTLFAWSGLLLAQTSFSDDMESYNDGDYIAANSTDWTTWSGATGGQEDAKITTEQASSGTKSIIIQSGTPTTNGPTDLVLPFGGKYETGKFHYEMMLYIESGAYFNFQGEVAIGSVWTFQPEFFPDGTVSINNSDNVSVRNASYPVAQWFKMEVDVDLTLNTWVVSFDGNEVARFSNPFNAVASIDIFPLAGHKFFVDDVAYSYEPFTPLANDLALTNIIVPNRGLEGKAYSLTAYVKNIGNTPINSFDITWSDGNNSGTENITGVDLQLLDEYEVVFGQQYTASDANSDVTITVYNINGGTDDNTDNDSKDANVTIVVPAQDKLFFVEEATGTWCTWCPRGAVWMERIHDEYTQYFAGVAVHNNDPMEVDEYDAGIRAFPGFSGFPSVIVDRTRVNDPSNLENDFFDQIVLPPVAKLTNDVTYNTVTRKLTIKANALMKETVSGDYRLNVIIREDGVTGTGSGYAQVNAYSGGSRGPMGGYENLPSPVPASMMVYDFTARAILGGFEGQQGSLPTDLNIGETYSADFEYTLPADYDETEIVVISIITTPFGDVSNAGMTGYADFALTSTDNVQNHEAFNGIAPNPFNDVTFINLDLNEATDVMVQLMDATGKLVASRDYGKLSGKQQLPVDAGNLMNGMYFTKIQIGDKFITRSIVLNR